MFLDCLDKPTGGSLHEQGTLLSHPVRHCHFAWHGHCLHLLPGRSCAQPGHSLSQDPSFLGNLRRVHLRLLGLLGPDEDQETGDPPLLCSCGCSYVLAHLWTDVLDDPVLNPTTYPAISPIAGFKFYIQPHYINYDHK